MLEAAVNGVSARRYGGKKGIGVTGWSEDVWDVVHSPYAMDGNWFKKTRLGGGSRQRMMNARKGAVFKEARST